LPPKMPAELHTLRAANETVFMDQITAAGLDLYFHNLAGYLGREADHPRAIRRGIFGHEQSAARHGATDGAEEAADAGGGVSGIELDPLRHPGKLAGFGHDLVAWREFQLQDGECLADDLRAHAVCLYWPLR
jgi:hypothetical protein